MKKKIICFTLCMLLLGLHISYASSYVMHTIKNGDTYWKVAQVYNKDVTQIQALNHILENNLTQGQLLKIQTLPTLSIVVNGKKIYSDQTAYLENNRVFVPIRFIAEALKVNEISWNNSSKTAVLKENDLTIQLPYQSNYAYVNGNAYFLDAPINIIGGRLYVPIRFIAETFNCDVGWDQNNYQVIINSKHSSSNTNISSDDLYWLSRIVEAEAGEEPFEGKLAVSNVIINRRKSLEFPNTIKDVIFDGYQFTPVLNGSIYNTPSIDSIEAATQALQGKNNIGDCLFFLNPRRSTNFWIINNRTYYTTINLHDFYV